MSDNNKNLLVLHILYTIGGPGQLPHLAPTYAAVLSLCILGTEEAYKAIDRSVMTLDIYCQIPIQTISAVISYQDAST